MVKIGSDVDRRYEVLEVLGQGGMGTVYKVRHRDLDALYALKTLDSQSYGATSQFQLEAQILARLQHVGLPRVIDFFTRKNRHYLVMDYIAGSDLDRLLQAQQAPLSASQVLPWLHQLLDILIYIHDQGIVHRDIKPANIKLTPEGQIRLVDFGIAKRAQATQLQTAFGAKGAFTPFLAAPEQMNGQGTDARTDLYALGATASYLLSNTLPVPVNLREFNSQLSLELVNWVKKAMAYLPAARFQSAREMKAALPPTSVTRSPAGLHTFKRDIRRR